MQDRYAASGEVIIREGDPGDVFVLLEEGIYIFIHIYSLLLLILFTLYI